MDSSGVPTRDQRTPLDQRASRFSKVTRLSGCSQEVRAETERPRKASERLLAAHAKAPAL